MRIIVNCSNLEKGGGIQVAISFIQECKHFNENEYHVFLSPKISSQLDLKEFSKNFHFYLIMKPPSSLTHAISTIHQLKKLEKRIKPNCVFTIFGPSYWTPKSKHLMGYAIPHYVYSEYFKKVDISVFNRYFILVKKVFQTYFFKRNANIFYTESFDVSKRLSHLLKICENKIFTIGNSYSQVFNSPLTNYNLLPTKEKNEFRLITISAYYPHKNLIIIKKAIPYLEKSGIKIRFILTLPGKIYKKEFNEYKDYIINIGQVPLSYCPYLYANSDAMFLPTLLECFSASYPEAMIMKKPILTSDLSFAHTICGAAAEYFDPLSPEDIANKIINLATNKDRQKELIKRGEEQLQHFETSYSRAKKLLDICESICKDEHII
jgi:glycosyltransferase involved in cell wall biosynthesis